MPKMVGVSALLLGALLLAAAMLWANLHPVLTFAEPEEVVFAATATGGSLLLTGFGIWAAKTAFTRKWLNYASALLLVPGIIAGAMFALLRSVIPYSMPGAWRYWLGCALATLCGALIAVSTLEPTIPIAARFERAAAEAATQLGLLDAQRFAKNAPLPRVVVARALASAFCLLVFVSLVAWNESTETLQTWLVGGWLLGWATLAIHELAHALCGLALGYRVTRLTIGGIPRLPDLELGAVRVSLGVIPSHGLTEFSVASVPTWQAMRRVAWAGPASGALLSVVGIFTFGAVPHRSLASEYAIILALCGLVSLGQLLPGPSDGMRTDGTWMFLPERVLRQLVYLSWLRRLRSNTAAPSDTPSAGQGFFSAWQRLSAEPVAEQRRGMLLSLDKVLSAAPSIESQLLASFLLGSLARLSPKDEDFPALDAQVTHFLAGEASAILKTRTLDVLACHLLFPPRNELLALGERWARQALEIHPDDPTLAGTLGSILVERGQKEEGRRLLRLVLERSTSTADRRIARRFLAV